MPAELTIAFHGKTVIYAFIAIESMDLVAGVARITRLQKGMVILDCPITRFCGSGTVGRRRPYSIQLPANIDGRSVQAITYQDATQ